MKLDSLISHFLEVPRHEARNLIFKWLYPRVFGEQTLIVFKRLSFYLLRRLMNEKMLFYPAKLRSLVKNGHLKSDQNIKSKPTSETRFGEQKLKLAQGCIKIKTKDDWNQAFTDIEVYVSLHRWNWLLNTGENSLSSPALAYDEGINLCRSWIEQMSPLPNGLASESYTVSERIANLCIFSRIHQGNWVELPDYLAASLHQMAAHLTRNLEIHPDGMTGNHIINNARALFIAGQSLEEPSFISISGELLKHWLPKLISKEGFLKEGSSHYQCILVRWLIEMSILADEHNDIETLNLLKPWLNSTLKAAQFFSVSRLDKHHNLALFGDISPDCSPAWLEGILSFKAIKYQKQKPSILYEVDNLCGWVGVMSKGFPKYFEKQSLKPQANIGKLPDESSVWRFCDEAGWYRLDYKKWTAIFHAQSSSGRARASHAHNDLCSVVLYHDGVNIFCDSGRLNYTKESLYSSYALSAKAHNSICIDGFDPMLSNRSRMLPKSYRKSDLAIKMSNFKNYSSFIIKHDGFNRIGKKCGSHTREFKFSAGEMVVEDFIDGFGLVESDFYWHLPDLNWRYKHQDRGVLIYNADNKKMTFECELHDEFLKFEGFSGSSEPLCGWRFPSYGEKLPAPSFNLNKHATLPLHCVHKLTVLKH